MKKVSLLFAGFSLFAILLFTSCAKDGPAGPAGATGPAGPAGPTGATGATGAAGTANVTYSAWLDVTYLPDTVRTNNILDTVGWYTTISAPKLTTAVLNNGEIKVYWNLSNPTTPVIVPIPYFDGGVIVQPYFFSTNIELDANTSLSTRVSNGAKIFQVRYILIPGGVPARSSLDYNDYEAVKKAYNIPD